MTDRNSNWRHLALALLGLALITIAQPMQAQTVTPTASAAKEEQLLSTMKQIDGRISIPDQKASVLMQPAGQEWRKVHSTTMFWVGAVSIIGMLLALTLFYSIRGRIMIDSGPSGRTILRFNGFERFVHWLTASCFIVLALSGLNVSFGKYLLLPLLGAEAFSAMSQLAKYAHNFLAFPFIIGLVFMFLVWVKDNIPEGGDLDWLKAGGGLMSKGHHPPAKKFNAGQKVIFWVVIGGGTVLSITGLMLLFPFSGTVIADLQLGQTIHGILSGLIVAVMMAHIYIGSVGMEGALDAMNSGEVDLNWAREHHSLWVEEVEAQEREAHDKAKSVAAE
ncbi:MAG: formate dehydrogenase subunit gamma [Rhizobiales bacterium]|jgi:formate dehydrogenase subunit gamma|nr:formate dehydrogenase subunit gamma [Hyphomicrobiales bacterium]